LHLLLLIIIGTQLLKMVISVENV